MGLHREGCFRSRLACFCVSVCERQCVCEQARARVCCGCTQSRRPRLGGVGASNGGGAACVTSESSRAHQSSSWLGRGTKKRKRAPLEGAESRASVSWFCAAGWGGREASARATYLQLTYSPRRTQTRSQSQSVLGVHEPASVPARVVLIEKHSNYIYIRHSQKTFLLCAQCSAASVAWPQPSCTEPSAAVRRVPV
jgi:hypothetical protein